MKQQQGLYCYSYYLVLPEQENRRHRAWKSLQMVLVATRVHVADGWANLRSRTQTKKYDHKMILTRTMVE